MKKSAPLAAVAGALIGGACLLLAQATTSWLTGTTDQKFNTLANIAPGLGTVMIEYGNRTGNVYYAAQVGNWGMAAYQLKEMAEIQEVGETTRPARKPLLVNFEQTYLVPLAKDIVNQDINAFNADFDKVVTGCNACHSGTSFGYVQYALPDKPSAPTKQVGGQTFSAADLQTLLSGILNP